jgi:hypothetical protein
MRFNHFPTRTVIYRRLQMLNQRSAAPDIYRLCAMTDAKNWLAEVEGVLEKEFVDGGPCRVRLAALGDSVFTISLRVNVVPTSREQHALHAGEQPGHAVLALMERDNDWNCAG